MEKKSLLRKDEGNDRGAATTWGRFAAVFKKKRPKLQSKARKSTDNAKPSESIVVAAIDFGTTYSGYAFSFKHDLDVDPLKMHCNEWTNAAQCQMNVKTPTCLLLDPDRKLHSFGNEAKTKYAALTLDKKHEDWFFFREFKMTLHQEKEINGNYQLTAENGKQLDALTVFSLSIQYFKDHLANILHRSFQDVEEKDVTWVITVPAIWNDTAKKFMRKAAEKGGIRKDCIEIALEPEAASLFCRQLSITRKSQKETGMIKLPAGTRYMILDCGGGTVDVAVHEVFEDNYLKELHKATGGHWVELWSTKPSWISFLHLSELTSSIGFLLNTSPTILKCLMNLRTRNDMQRWILGTKWPLECQSYYKRCFAIRQALS